MLRGGFLGSGLECFNFRIGIFFGPIFLFVSCSWFERVSVLVVRGGAPWILGDECAFQGSRIDDEGVSHWIGKGGFCKFTTTRRASLVGAAWLGNLSKLLCLLMGLPYLSSLPGLGSQSAATCLWDPQRICDAHRPGSCLFRGSGSNDAGGGREVFEGATVTMQIFFVTDDRCLEMVLNSRKWPLLKGCWCWNKIEVDW